MEHVIDYCPFLPRMDTLKLNFHTFSQKETETILENFTSHFGSWWIFVFLFVIKTYIFTKLGHSYVVTLTTGPEKRERILTDLKKNKL